MPKRRLPWFKVWIGATRHQKVAPLDDATFRVWIELLDAGAQQPQRGQFPSVSVAAAIIRRPVVAIEILVTSGLVDLHEDGSISMHDWPDWQRWDRDADGIDTGLTPESHANHTRLTDDSLRQELRVKKRDVEDIETTSLSPERAPAEAVDQSEHEVFEYYREHVQPEARVFPGVKIRARLKRFSVDELKAGVDHFAADSWWMTNNASRGAAWFFHSDQRSEQFLNLEPRVPTPLYSTGRGVSHV